MRPSKTDKLDIHLEGKAGYRISLSNGTLQKGFTDRMSTEFFYKAFKGSKLSLLSRDYYYAVATYSFDRDSKYIYTYDYQLDESWTTYNHDLTAESYTQSDYEFFDEVYFRVNLKRVDNKDISEMEAFNLWKILRYITIEEVYQEKEYFTEEIEAVSTRIKQKISKNTLKLVLLTDTHYTVNGTWLDTAHNIGRVNQLVGFDGIIHLGDFTDGMVSAKVTTKYVQQIFVDLHKNKIPIYPILGNHDSNYFYNNPEQFTEKAQQDIYLKHLDYYIKRNPKQAYYYVDFNKVHIRGIFLKSYASSENKERYGFDNEQLNWLKGVLENTPEKYGIIIFSHVPPLACLHYWSDTIRNEEALIELLEEYNRGEEKKIYAFIHGHNHADQIYREKSFPIISIGCAKCEYFVDKKPVGAVVAERKLNTVTQDLWDTLLIDPVENRVELVRFGAGEDRIIL